MNRQHSGLGRSHSSFFGWAMVIGYLISAAISLAVLWGVASVVTSGIKVATKECGTEYRIEYVASISGDWFCPVTK